MKLPNRIGVNYRSESPKQKRTLLNVPQSTNNLSSTNFLKNELNQLNKYLKFVTNSVKNIKSDSFNGQLIAIEKGNSK